MKSLVPLCLLPAVADAESPRPRRRPSAPSSDSTCPRDSRWPCRCSGNSALMRSAPAPREGCSSRPQDVGGARAALLHFCTVVIMHARLQISLPFLASNVMARCRRQYKRLVLSCSIRTGTSSEITKQLNPQQMPD